MRVLGDDIHTSDNTITIVRFLIMLSVGTTVHVHVDDSETIHIHTIQSAETTLQFLQHLYGEVKHLLRVYEITTFTSENGSGLEVYCV